VGGGGGGGGQRSGLIIPVIFCLFLKHYFSLSLSFTMTKLSMLFIMTILSRLLISTVHRPGATVILESFIIFVFVYKEAIYM